jgi:hypothetical protein
MNELNKETRTPPGEGERRAVRGLVSQYDFAARVIYASLASRRLRWVGLADRRAGSFDDVVLGLNDKIVGHQIKSSRDPDSFNVRTLLLEAEKLLSKLLDSWTNFARIIPMLEWRSRLLPTIFRAPGTISVAWIDEFRQQRSCERTRLIAANGQCESGAPPSSVPLSMT